MGEWSPPFTARLPVHREIPGIIISIRIPIVILARKNQTMMW